MNGRLTGQSSPTLPLSTCLPLPQVKKISNFLPSDFQKHLAINTTMAITKTVLFNVAGA